ncbi:MAG: hypothetical protein U0836_13895 [Pirellulales bacterium]
MEPIPNPYLLTAEQQAHLASLVEQLGQPPSQVIDVALGGIAPRSGALTAANGETFFEAASRLGFIGCIDDGPADLSTNPKYMEGFGGRGG